MADKDQKFYTTGDASCTSGGVVPVVFSKTCLTCAEGEAPIDIEAITWQGSTYTLTFFLTDQTKRTLVLTHTHALGELSDVDVSGVSTGQVLSKSAGDWVPLTLSTVATSGDYNDLLNKPTYSLNDLTDVTVSGATTDQVLKKSAGDWIPATLAQVAFTGSYSNLLDKPFAVGPTDQAVTYYNAGTALYTTIGRPAVFESKVLTYNSLGDLVWEDIEFLAAGATNSLQYKGPTGILAGSANYTYNGTNAQLTGGYLQVGNLRLEDSTFQNLSGRLTISSATDIKVTNLTTGAESLVKVDANGVLGTTLATNFINGTVNYIPKFSSASSIIDSDAFYVGTNLTLGHTGSTTITGLAGSGIRLVSVDPSGTLINDGIGTAGVLPLWEGTDNLTNSKISQVGADVLVSLTGGGGLRAGNTTAENTYIQTAVNYGGASQVAMTLTVSTTAGSLQFNDSGTGHGQMYMTTTEIGFYEGAAISGNRIMQMDLTANTIIFNRPLYIANSPDIGTTSNQILTRDTSTGEVEYLNISAFTPAAGTFVEIGATTAGRILCKVITIGDWDMDSTEFIQKDTGLSHSLIRAVFVSILDDSSTVTSPLNLINTTTGDIDGGWLDVGNIPANPTNIQLYRKTGGHFDQAIYNATSFNRGFITIIYEDLPL